MRDDDDEHIGPFNGHNKSEAIPNGCVMVVAIVIIFILAMASWGFIADALK